SRETFKSLRIIFSAGATLAPVAERAEQAFGFPVSNVYGSSEVLALAAFWGPAFWDPKGKAADRARAGGQLVSDGMCVRAVDVSGAVLPVGTAGELQFHGPVIT